MAVVQISKIQLRRGKKLETGMPQLASGEMAWAVDTQELYIGNGAVSEGAPSVGNTKILTENDTILDLLEQYQYKPSDVTILTGLDGEVTKRTLQSRLDDGAVNASNFGISGLDSAIDQTALIQNAIYSLYLSTVPENRVTLEFDPGTYTITGTLYIPSNVRLVGSGKDLTIFNFIQGGLNQATSLTLSGTSITSSGSYAGLTTTAVTGTGTGAVVTISKTGTGASYTLSNTTVSIVNCGEGYHDGDQIKVLGSSLGGSSPANDLTITVSSTATNPVFDTTTVIEFINETSTTTERNVSPTSPSNQAKNIVFKDFTINTNNDSVRPLYFLNVKESEFNNIKVLGEWVSGDGDIELSRAIELTSTGSFTTTCQKNKFIGLEVEGFSYGVFSNTDTMLNTFRDCNFKTLNVGIGFGVGAGLSAAGPKKNVIENCMFDTINQHGLIVDKGTDNRSRGNTFINVGNDGGSSTNNVYSHIKFTTPGNSSTNDSFDRAGTLSGISTYAYISEVEGYSRRSEMSPTKISLNSTTSSLLAFRLPLNTSSAFEINYVYQSTAYSQMRKGTFHIAVDKNNTNVQLVDEYEYTGTPGQDSRIIFTASIVTSSGVKSIGIYYTNANTSDTNTFTYTVNSLAS
jgi:hypothetical protein